MRISVDFAPLSEVALVDIPGVTCTPGQPVCYAIGSWGCREENAPQMFNTHCDPSMDRVEMDDEHPFPKVKAELDRRIEISRANIRAMLEGRDEESGVS